MPFTPAAVNLFISDQINRVTLCGATDVSAEFPGFESWVSTFGLKVMFHDHLRSEVRPVVLQILRRAEMAMAEYSKAYQALADLVGGPRGRWSIYYRALHHFEAAASQLYQAYDYSRQLLDTRLFAKGDGSPLEKLNQLYNTVKHEVASGDQPVWITDAGIETKGGQITFGEFEELLRSLGSLSVGLLKDPSDAAAAAPM